MVKNVRHFGIVVGDVDRSVRFYRDLLGLKIVKVAMESGPYIDNILALDHVSVKTVKMAAGEGETLLELLEFVSHPRHFDPGREICSLGPSHLAFTVENVDSLYEQLSLSGVSFNGPPQVSPDGYARVAFCKDPDGSSIELVEVIGGGGLKTSSVYGRSQ